MQKFRQPVAMEVTNEQYEKDLKEPLKELGYSSQPAPDFLVGLDPNPLPLEFLKTDWCEVNSSYGFSKTIKGSIARKNTKRTIIDSYNPELFLAIAAMTVDAKPIVGEHLIMENAGSWSYSPVNNGCLAKVLRVGSRDDILTDTQVISVSGKVLNPNKEAYINFTNIPIMDRNGVPIWRKATIDELKAHYISEKTTQIVDSTTLPKIDINLLNKNDVIHCPTQAEAIELNKLYGSDILINFWSTYKEHTCFCPKKNQFSQYAFYEKEGYNIYKAEQFLNINTKQNEKLQTIKKSVNKPIRGEKIKLSRKKKQTTISSRLVGNRVSTGRKKARVRESVYEGHTIKC